MPVKRRTPKERIGEVSVIAWGMLTDGPLPDPLTEAEKAEQFVLSIDLPAYDGQTLQAMWQKHGPEIIEAWAEEKPGTRPSCWWKWSAPEQLREGEAQAAFLERHGLLLPGERRRLP